MGKTKKEKERAKTKTPGNQSNVEDEQEVRDLIKIVLEKLDGFTNKADKDRKECEEKIESCNFVQGVHSDRIGKLVEEVNSLRAEMDTLKTENKKMGKTVDMLNSKVSEFDIKFEVKDREAKEIIFASKE